MPLSTQAQSKLTTAMAKPGVLTCVQSPIRPRRSLYTSACSNSENALSCTRRKSLIFFASSLLASSAPFPHAPSLSCFLSPSIAQEVDELDQEETRVVRIFQETSSSVVYIKDFALSSIPQSTSEIGLDEEDNGKVEGSGSGFIWDEFGHIVTNYHVISKLATDTSGLHRCKVSFVDSQGSNITSNAKIVGYDPDYDLAVLKVDAVGIELKPVAIGKSHALRVGQSCFAIGNPYGYENTLTTGIISGLGREIPSPNGRAIRGAIQTDASINAGNSGGPLIDSYGHVIGVNTATFTRKGSGMSSGVNFAIPIDTVVRAVPYLIVYGTPYSNRY
ncbi:protease Do-like 5, chloroplastic [Andrographis paniculata]|uniref:protease Do-like 5, chloroplastic n=1 Tax=Andrographis paniculata TaxID=175694 RepID=UPI0021E76468|nr:protease Do-like 5, chloroplastic [Andrographis paniculata]